MNPPNESATPRAPAFQAIAVSRRFGETQALDSVDYELRAGEIHALVGENGAGKTTFAKIAAGALRADSGELRLFGEVYNPRRRVDGSAAGVAHVRQQLSLVRGLTVAQNIALGRPRLGAARRRLWPRVFSNSAAKAEVEQLSEELDLKVPADELVDDLPLAVRQQAEILISLAWGARMLVLDEPSSALGPLETEALIRLCLRLRDEGTPIIYISHRLGELAELADRLTVLRSGRVVVAGSDVADADLRKLAEIMVGDISLLDVQRPRTNVGDVRLSVEGLELTTEHGTGLHDVSLQVRGGEIVGIVGVAGNGQEELAALITGQVKPDRGSISVDGRDVTGSPARAAAQGVALLPEDRSAGIAGKFSAAENVIARRFGESPFSRWGIRRLKPVKRHARELAERFEVNPPNPDLPAGSLSGGNQQKLVAARELEREPALLVACGPTKGLDPQASRTMRDRCYETTRGGGAVVLISADLDEVAELAHQVLVLSGGRLVDSFPTDEMNPVRLGAAMAGLDLETPASQERQ